MQISQTATKVPNDEPVFGAWFEQRRTEFEGWFRDIHANPELGFEETATAAYVAERLRAAGVEVETGSGGTGVIGVVRGSQIGADGAGRVIGLRAELDALPMRSAVAAPDSDNRFHGCGHDGHTVTLLTAATYLAEHSDFAGTAVFIFQPAEELLSGARAMLDDGLFDRYPCDEVYALHNLPGFPRGHVGVAARGALASSDDLTVTVRARGTHGSAPHTGSDGVLAAATFLTTLQQCVTRVIDSRDSGVISFGRIAGGHAGNVLPDEVVIDGTMRTHAQEVRDRLAAQIESVARAVEVSHGVEIELRIENRVPVTQNHAPAVAAVVETAGRVVGPDRVVADARPLMAGEDFSLMLEAVPGAYFFVGQDGAYCHDPEYRFDLDVIPVGAAIFVDLVRSRSSADTEIQFT